jgi:hypothetical protein
MTIPRPVSSTPDERALPTDGIPAQQRFSRQQALYVWLCAIFVTCLVLADVIGVKLFRIQLGGLSIDHTCGMLTFPATFLLTDLINEYYGRRGARRVTWVAFGMGIFAFAVLNAAMAMPRLPAPFGVSDQSFREVFGSAQVMFIASLAAFLVGQFSDIFVFRTLKRATKGRMIWLRATGSTLVSQVIDSLVVTTLAFNVGRRVFPEEGALPIPMLPDASDPSGTYILKMAATGYMLKFVIALALTPLVYLGHSVLNRGFGLVPVPHDEQ